MSRYRYKKLPVDIEALKYTGNNAMNIISRFGNECVNFEGPNLYIHTPDGRMCAQIGDYIIKDVTGEVYPCKSVEFEQTYEAVVVQ